jgi:hypothetical protein
MALSDDLGRIAVAGGAHAQPAEELAAILVTESPSGRRTYLCAYDDGTRRTWLALDDGGEPVVSGARVREAVSVAALYEIAVETASESDEEPRIASFAALDDLGGREPNVAAAIRDAVTSVDELTREVESNYKLPLTGGD